MKDEKAVEKVSELHAEIYSGLQDHGYPFPGARELIADLAEKGYDLWFVTSANPEELEGRISGVVNSSNVENSKPAPDIFELSLQKANAAPDETVALGDTIWDVKAAKATGVRTVAGLTGGAFDEEDQKGAGAVYKDCAALLESNFPE